MSLKSLSESVEAHLRGYFNVQGEDFPSGGIYNRIIEEVERPLIMMSLTACRGNQLRAAELLGINRNTLRKRIRELGIPPERAHYRKAA
ncbi:MAG TPA: helix-turn-helix domain-containing protein [Alphaproteobacteria bacterium]|nr:helix-turn-helix domain-containing protein [Alphaproteobacteria bacterium]